MVHDYNASFDTHEYKDSAHMCIELWTPSSTNSILPDVSNENRAAIVVYKY